MNKKQNERRKGVVVSTMVKLVLIGLIIFNLPKGAIVSLLVIVLLAAMILMDAKLEYYNYGRLDEVNKDED